MSDQVSVENTPKAFLRAHRPAGISAGFRLPLFGAVLESGAVWLRNGAWSLTSWETGFRFDSYWNGPRSVTFGAIIGFLKLRVGFDVTVILGRRNPEAQKMLLDAMHQSLAAEFERQRLTAKQNVGPAEVQYVPPVPAPKPEINFDGLEILK